MGSWTSLFSGLFLHNPEYSALLKVQSIAFAVFFIAYPADLYPQQTPIEGLGISLLTCDPGDELYSIFGHSAIRVWNDDRTFDHVYNYGTFDFNTPGFLMKFLRGKLPYMLSKGSYEYFLLAYNAEKRSIREQEFSLTSEEKTQMLQFLEWNLMPENRFYPYDFFFDNCATRIRDVIPLATVKRVEWPQDNQGKTFRNLLHEYLSGKPWTEFGIDLLIGAVADQQASVSDQMFLPDYLHDHFEDTRIVESENVENLVLYDYEVLLYNEERVKRLTRPFFTPHLIFLLLVTLEIYLLFIAKTSPWVNFYDKVFFTIMGIGSTIMLLLWFATDHQACAQNWNLIWANPLYFVLLFIKDPKIKKYVIFTLLTGLGLAFLNIFFQYLPQEFNLYKLGIIILAGIKLYRCLRTDHLLPGFLSLKKV